MCKCISAFAKCLLIAVNTVTLTIGLALIVVGSLMLNDKSFVANLLSKEAPKVEVTLKKLTEEQVNTELNTFFTTAGGIILGIGIFVFCLSFVGFVGVLRKSRCLLMTYVFVTTVLTLLQTITIILAAVFEKQLEQHIQTFLKGTLEDYGNDKSVRAVWNKKMETLNCCGVTGYTDFKNLTESNVTSEMVLQDIIKHCCNPNVFSCKVDPSTIEALNSNNVKQGCSNIAFQKFKDHYYADIVLVAILIITNGLAIAAALGMNTKEETTTDSQPRATREMRRKDSDASNLKSLSQMKNPAASTRDSTFMYENI